MSEETKNTNTKKNEILNDDELDMVAGGAGTSDAGKQTASSKPRPPKPSPNVKHE